MNDDATPTIFVSPTSRAPLFRYNDVLMTADHQESFPIEDEIFLLLQQQATTAALNHEIDIFDNLPIQEVSYFRSLLYRQASNKLIGYLPPKILAEAAVVRFAELGGGEGHCARHIVRAIAQAAVYVCDLSKRALGHAPAPLQRICADITQPVFAPDSLDAAAFWVSLHHIPRNQRKQALEEAYCALKEGGILILFEPNEAFFLRRLVYASACRHDLYFDDEEGAVDFFEVTALAREIGFDEAATFYMNPPYNPAFVRQLKRWWLYLPTVELIYQAGRLMNRGQSGSHTSRSRYASLYGMSFFRKPSR